MLLTGIYFAFFRRKPAVMAIVLLPLTLFLIGALIASTIGGEIIGRTLHNLKPHRLQRLNRGPDIGSGSLYDS